MQHTFTVGTTRYRLIYSKSGPITYGSLVLDGNNISVSGTILTQTAVCSPSDRYSYAKGRKLVTAKLLTMYFPRDQREGIWKQLKPEQKPKTPKIRGGFELINYMKKTGTGRKS